ncbi:MAG: VOC family protein [Geminicoccaceae bacterium]
MLTLDHVGLFTDDLDALARRLEQAGLLLSPLTPQFNRDATGKEVPAGTANRLAILADGYLEFLTPVSDTPLARQMRHAIERYRGFHLVAFGTDDAAADHRRLEEGGFEPLPLVHLRRAVEEGGEPRIAQFSVARVPPVAMPEGRIQFCQHHTPELVWREPWRTQPNGWLALNDVLLCVEDAEAVAARYAAFTGLAARCIADGQWLLETARGRVAFMEPSRLRGFPHPFPAPPSMPAIAVASHAPAGIIDLRPQAEALVEIVPPGIDPFWLR